MASTAGQVALFSAEEMSGLAEGVVAINDRCRIETRDGHRVVSVSGLTLAHYAVGDRMAEAYAMVSLVEQGWSSQIEVAAAFGVDVRTVRRNQRRFESGGLVALGRSAGYPKGVPRLPRSRGEQVSRWKAEGLSNREIASRLGVSEMAARKQLKRLGWRPAQSQQELFAGGCEDANPNLSGAECTTTSSAGCEAERPAASSAPDANPNLSGTEPGDQELLPVSLDHDPGDRTVDRVLACLALLDDAAPLFGHGDAGAGRRVVARDPRTGCERSVLDRAEDLRQHRTGVLRSAHDAADVARDGPAPHQAAGGLEGAFAGCSRSIVGVGSRARGQDFATEARASCRCRPRRRVRAGAGTTSRADAWSRHWLSLRRRTRTRVPRQIPPAEGAPCADAVGDARHDRLLDQRRRGRAAVRGHGRGERGARTGPAGHPRRGPRTDR
ncbi:MAG: helix-turn-helix domain-containing protein [Planctomycetes bacterium]|nr:helix-turn-helix domain-containing protein [Planctomycetota bacterium]